MQDILLTAQDYCDIGVGANSVRYSLGYQFVFLRRGEGLQRRLPYTPGLRVRAEAIPVSVAELIQEASQRVVAIVKHPLPIPYFPMRQVPCSTSGFREKLRYALRCKLLSDELERLTCVLGRGAVPPLTLLIEPLVIEADNFPGVVVPPPDAPQFFSVLVHYKLSHPSGMVRRVGDAYGRCTNQSPIRSRLTQASDDSQQRWVCSSRNGCVGDRLPALHIGEFHRGVAVGVFVDHVLLL